MVSVLRPHLPASHLQAALLYMALTVQCTSKGRKRGEIYMKHDNSIPWSCSVLQWDTRLAGMERSAPKVGLGLKVIDP